MVSTTTITDKNSSVSVGKIAHGLMMMTWKPTPVPDEDCFESIKASLDSVPPGTKMILNSGEFYGNNPPTANLELVARFFEKYPEYADKAFLSVKGAIGPGLKPDSSPEGLKRSVDNILAKLRGTKKLDLFEPARVDPNYPIEETMKVLSGFVKEGKFDYIGISEAKAETLKRAHSVYPVAAIEIEVSPWSYFEETKRVIATAGELGVAVIAYSPLGKGFLTGQITKIEDLEEGDIRRHFTRFQEQYFKHNMAIVEGIKAVAAKKNATAAQLCIAWVSALGDHVIPLPGSSNAKRTKENIAANQIELTGDDMAEIAKVLEENPVKGGRYFGEAEDDTQTWG